MEIGTGLSFLWDVSFEFFAVFLIKIAIFIRIAKYGTASTDSAAYILGGRIGWSSKPWRTNTIAQFKNNKWRKIGELKEVKSDASAILFHGEYLIIGGDPDEYTTGRLVNWLNNRHIFIVFFS